MKVFLVDDEIVIREGIRESFPWDDTPYELVGEAPDGEMALPMIRDTNPDIVITDIKMPFMDGLELCRVLRTQMPWIGIVVLSGYDEFEYARQCIQLGVREYLLKPISSTDLKEVLDKISRQISEERKSLEHASSLRARMGNDEKLIKEKLIGSLFSDEAAPEDAPNVIKQLSSMGCPVPSPFYVVIDAAFEPMKTGQEAIVLLTESSNGAVHSSPGRVGTRLLVLGETNEDAEEKAYSMATSLVQELDRANCKEIRIGIGEIVDKPEEIIHSFKTARHIRHLLVERKEEGALILGVREMGDVKDDMPSVINEAKLYMSQHFSDPNLMLPDVANAVNMSKSRFSAVFSQCTGQTFTEYLIHLRLNKAKELLKTTAYKNSLIAHETGYNDSHYFSYIFKKNTGMTPSEYREKYKI
ncbi:MAG: response regulator [Lachnospiraceae bacterium]|nr:response regulator [Lachnospiraceae bacterium]